MPDDVPAPDPEYLPGLEPEPGDSVAPPDTGRVEPEKGEPPSHSVDDHGRWWFDDRVHPEQYDQGAFKPDREALNRWFWEHLNKDSTLSDWYDGEYDLPLRRPETYRYEELVRIYHDYLAAMKPDAELAPVPSAPPPPYAGKPVRGRRRLLRFAPVVVVAVGVVGVGAGLLSNGEDQEPDADATAPTTVVVADAAGEASATEAPTAASGANTTAATSAAPATTAAAQPATTIPIGNPATTVLSMIYSKGSHVLTSTVAGDGRAFAASETTKWYNWRFLIHTPDGSLTVDGKWARGREFSADVWNGDQMAGELIPGAVVTAEWTSADTVVMVIDQVDVAAAADSVELELTARVIEADGTETDYEDTVTWER